MNGATSGFVVPGKVNMIIDGQFGSTGKGLLASKISEDNYIDIAASTLSPNAGHTFYKNGNKFVTRQFPVSGIIHEDSIIYMSADSVIDETVFFREMEEFGIDPKRIFIHPRAAVVSAEYIEQEKMSLTRIASVTSGTGMSRASKILRENPLAQGSKRLSKFTKHFDFPLHLNSGANVLCETSQGLDLGINHGFSYPYCSTMDVLPSNVLGSLGLHPRYMGNVYLSVRAYPIRVGNPKDSQGNELGFSGPVWSDQHEIDFSMLGVEEEMSTVSKRKRRLFTWSQMQYENALKMIEPTHVFLNFVNYICKADLEKYRFSESQVPDTMGLSPYNDDVVPYDFSLIESKVL